MKHVITALLAAFLTLPVTAGVLEISIDLDRGVAYVPAGTVLPPGMTVRAAATRQVDWMDEPMLRNHPRFFEMRQRAHRRPAPLRIEYADDSRFVGLRAHFGSELADKKARFSARPNSQSCYDTYYDATVDTWYTGYFKSTFCFDSPGLQVGQYGTWAFGSQAWGGADAEAYVSDDNNNYNCSNQSLGYGTASCSDSAYTQLHNVGNCRNVVVTGGTTTFWEYLSEYEIAYHIVSAYIDYCNFFD
jgi:hypothetical protein